MSIFTIVRVNILQGCLFAARRVRIADGHRHRILYNRTQCMPSDEVWLVGAERSTGEQKH